MKPCRARSRSFRKPTRPDVTHQAGARHHTRCANVLGRGHCRETWSRSSTTWRPRTRQADLMICRAGASTIAELAAAGVPAVLVPFPHAVDDHQTHNARFLSECGAAILIPQAELTAQKLADLIARLYARSALAMAQAAPRCRKTRSDARRRRSDAWRWRHEAQSQTRALRRDRRTDASRKQGLPLCAGMRPEAIGEGRRFANAIGSARMKHKVKHVHFVGIGGSGMSGIAEVLLNLGYRGQRIGSRRQRRHAAPAEPRREDLQGPRAANRSTAGCGRDFDCGRGRQPGGRRRARAKKFRSCRAR